MLAALLAGLVFVCWIVCGTRRSSHKEIQLVGRGARRLAAARRAIPAELALLAMTTAYSVRDDRGRSSPCWHRRARDSSNTAARGVVRLHRAKRRRARSRTADEDRLVAPVHVLRARSEGRFRRSRFVRAQHTAHVTPHRPTRPWTRLARAPHDSARVCGSTSEVARARVTVGSVRKRRTTKPACNCARVAAVLLYSWAFLA